MEKKLDIRFIISIVLVSIYLIIEAVLCFIGYDMKKVFGPIVIAVLAPMVMAQLIYIRRIELAGSILVSLYSVAVSVATLAISTSIKELFNSEWLVYVIGVLIGLVYVGGIWILHFWSMKNKPEFKKQKFSLDPKENK